MPSWAWVLIAIAVVVVLALVVWQALATRRTDRLRKTFGPEYDRTVGTAGSKHDAEVDLKERADRRERLNVRPLPEESQQRYRDRWQKVQAQFVDDPQGAVANADALIASAMAERGYPVEDFEQRAADVSVDHPQVVESYREGHRLAAASADGTGSTEDLRRAMQCYRDLFDDLIDSPADEPLRRDESAMDEGPTVYPDEKGATRR